MGRSLAERLGYPADLLDALPPISVEAFAGVANVAIFAELPHGASVLDLGCGAGLDSLIAGRRVGPTGHVIGIDFETKRLVAGSTRLAAGTLTDPGTRPGRP